MFDHMDGVMQALAKKKTQWKEDLFIAVKCVRQQLSKYYTEVTPMAGKLLILAHILDSVWKLRLLRQWDEQMNTNLEDETSYTTQYQESSLKYVENEYCVKHRRLRVTKHENIPNNKFTSYAMATTSGQNMNDPYDLSSDDEEY